jgi:hypothetical protein
MDGGRVVRAPYNGVIGGTSWDAEARGHVYRVSVHTFTGRADVWRFCGPTGRYRKVRRFHMTELWASAADEDRANRALHVALATGAE